MQTYEPFHLRKFRAVHQDLVALRTFRFAHVASDCILLRLPDGSCTISSDLLTLEVSDGAHKTYKQVSTGASLIAIVKAVKALGKARKGKEAPES